MEELMLMEILKQMKKKYQFIVEIERITREMGDSLSRNDRTSVQILIGMRQEEIDQAENCEKNIRRLLSSLTPTEAVQVRDWIKGKKDRKLESLVAEKLVESGNNIRSVLKRTIEVDRYINTRLAGDHSYYK